MADIENLVAIRSLLGTFIAAATFSLVYCWLKPKPLNRFPHNPVTSILGDIPEIMRTIKSGKTINDYYALLIERHGPIVQV